jgi:hypothetical protein
MIPIIVQDDCCSLGSHQAASDPQMTLDGSNTSFVGLDFQMDIEAPFHSAIHSVANCGVEGGIPLVVRICQVPGHKATDML